MRVIFLDAGPLSLLANPKKVPAAVQIRQWVKDLSAAGAVVCIPEIADYEVRRELLRAGKAAGLARLDFLRSRMAFAPIVGGVMDQAAGLWASARNAGRPTAAPEALDGDCILAAQAILAATPDDPVTVATTNVAHLGLFVDARPWEQIAP